VLPALAETYNDFGNPATNKADNGPPFNSEAFKTFSDKRGISIKHTPPYHPQANEAEYFMKPLGKPVKIAIGTNKPIKEAVTNLLTSYLIWHTNHLWLFKEGLSSDMHHNNKYH